MDRTAARQKAEALVAQMTLEEAASQLRYDAPAIDRLGVPAYNWWNEALHGVARAGTATMFPQAIGMAASFDPALVRQLGGIVAEEGRAKYNAASAHGDRDIYKGLTFWSPNINIFRDPRWGRGHETYGEDPFLTGETSAAYVEGIQGNGTVLKAAACAKHFAVHSGPEKTRHSFNVCPSRKDLYETYLPAFRKLVVQAHVEAIMGAYNRVDGEPCCGSRQLMVDILRGQWGFEGHYVSDCGAIQDFHQFHQITDTPEESAALALKMGCDVNCGSTYVYLMKAFEKGLVTEEEIRRAAIRLFTTRYLLGIMEGCEYDRIPYETVACAPHREKALEAARKGCVLLKNDGLLPLDMKKIRTLGVIGPNADSRRALIGNYHGTAPQYVTVLDGLQSAVGDSARILYAQGSPLFGKAVEFSLAQDNDRLSEAVTVAEHSDAVVLVVGLDETLEGEAGDASNADASGDKTSLLLPQAQRVLMEGVLAVGKPTVIVLMSGSSIDLQDAGNSANAVLLGWYPGAEGGRAIVDILLGKCSPSGKLPVTFYRNEQLSTMPDFSDYSMRGRTYRYLEDAPRYPFGYGLTYGDVSVRSAAARFTPAGVCIDACLFNDGRVSTEDVVQVYVQNEGSVHAPLHPRLCGFARVHCPAGEEARVSLTVDPACLTVVDDEGRSVQEGAPVFYIGMGQPDALTAALTGHAALRVVPCGEAKP